jgi:hypothetical protein
MKKQNRFYFWIHYIRPVLRKTIRYAQRNLNFREWVAIAAIAYCMLPVLFYTLLYQFQNKEIAALKHRIAVQGAQLQHKEQTSPPEKNTFRSAELSESEEFKKGYRPFDPSQPSGPKNGFPILEYLKTTKDAAWQSIIDLTVTHRLYTNDPTATLKISDTPIKNDLGVHNYPISLTLSGTYSDIGEFFFSLYALPIVLEITHLSLEPETDSEYLVLHTEMVLSIYESTRL